MSLRKSKILLLTSMMTAIASTTYASLNDDISKSQQLISSNNYVKEFNYYKEVSSQYSPDELTTYNARRAASYINNNEPNRAIKILKPYINSSTNKFVMSDYLMALRAAGYPNEVIKTVNTYVSDWNNLPIYGIQELGDVYLRKHDYKNAAKVYRHILSRDTAENQPFTQLGYAYCLARLGKTTQALDEYTKVANLANRINNIIIGDAETFLSEGKIGISRKMFRLLGKSDEDKERYQLEYARRLVNVDKDYESFTLNYKRDELMLDRSYYHEASSILNKLRTSNHKDIAQKADILIAKNKLNKDLIQDATDKVNELMSNDNKNPEVHGVASEVENTNKNQIYTYYEKDIDNKRNTDQELGLSYETYLSNNITIGEDISHHWLSDDNTSASYTQLSTNLTKKYDWGSIYGSWTYYDKSLSTQGYNLGMTYEFSDVTKLAYDHGIRLHRSAGTINDGTRDNYNKILLSHRLSPRTNIFGSYELVNISDGNKKWTYNLGLTQLLDVKNNYSDRLLLNYARTHYDNEYWYYDSPKYRTEHTIGWLRQWKLEEPGITWRLTPSVSIDHDYGEPNTINPGIKLEYIKEFANDQELQVGVSYRRYYRQVNPSRRNDGMSVNVSYNWSW